MAGSGDAARLATRGTQPPIPLSVAIWQVFRSLREGGTAPAAITIALGALLFSLVRLLVLWVMRRRKENQQRLSWTKHEDLGVVQACILSTEHLAQLGRVEKRTLFVKPTSEVFTNEYILREVLEAAQRANEGGDPILTTQLSQEDKWAVLTTCTNHLSSLFAPYHIFFNEARRVESYYRSAWYCFTITAERTSGQGRYFIVPFKPVVHQVDAGMFRIRILMVNEQELRDVASGATEAPSFGFFNSRHEGRWNTLLRFAELFGRQVQQVTGSSDLATDWGPNLCGRLKKSASKASVAMSRRGLQGNGHLGGDRSPHKAEAAAQEANLYSNEDNTFLRLHVPFPAAKMNTSRAHTSSDVVLFE